MNKKDKHDRRVLGKLNAELLLTESLILLKKEAEWFKRKCSFTECIVNSLYLFPLWECRRAVPPG